jgi:hypothetical protein
MDCKAWIKMAVSLLPVGMAVSGSVGMRRYGHMRRWRGCALLVVTLVILAGCASLKPAGGTPITNISLIAGDWAGTITPPYEPFYLKITPDRKLVAAWGPNYAWGTVTLRNGQATFEMQPPLLEGTIRLYLDGDRRTLALDDRWASFNAQVRPGASGLP